MRVEPGSPAKSPPAAVAEKAGNPAEGSSLEGVHPLAPGYHNRLAFPEMDDQTGPERAALACACSCGGCWGGVMHTARALAPAPHPAPAPAPIA